MPISAILDSDDFKGKKVSLRLAIMLVFGAILITFIGAEIWFQFQDVRKDMQVLQERIEYERARNDRKFNDLEQWHK